MTNRTIGILFSLLILAATGGFFLLNDLFSVAYQAPVSSRAFVQSVELMRDIEHLQELTERTDPGAAPVVEEPVRRLVDRYRQEVVVVSAQLDPILKGRINSYHEELWPLIDKWAGGTLLNDAERRDLRSDLRTLRKILSLGGKRIEREALRERRDMLVSRVRAAAALFGAALLFSFGGVLFAWRAGRRRILFERRTPEIAPTLEPIAVDNGRQREEARERTIGKRYRDILDSLPAAVVGVDTVSGHVLFVNAAFRDWFGLRDELIGERIDMVTLKSGVPLNEPGKFTQGGTTYWRDITQAGETTLYLVRDISEQDRLAARLLNSERLISIGEMASKVTHEIRNPLSTVKMNAEYIADHAAHLSTEELGGAIDRIVREVARLEEITDRYMGMVRYRAEDESSPRVQLPAALEDLLKFHEGEFAKRGIVLSLEPAPAATLTLSLNSFREVMLNLLKNAWEELGTGGTVRVTASLDGEMARVVVEDSGHGIPGAEREKIFRNFYTTKPGGTGIGLSHSLKLVHEVGGSITVTDSSWGGARFEVSLPLAAKVQG